MEPCAGRGMRDNAELWGSGARARRPIDPDRLSRVRVRVQRGFKRRKCISPTSKPKEAHPRSFCSSLKSFKKVSSTRKKKTLTLLKKIHGPQSVVSAKPSAQVSPCEAAGWKRDQRSALAPLRQWSSSRVQRCTAAPTTVRVEEEEDRL